MTAAKTDPAPLVYAAWASVLAGLSHIPKERSQGVSYTFRSVDAVMQHLHPLLAANGLTLSPRVMDDWHIERFEDAKGRLVTQATFRLEVWVVASDGSEHLAGRGLAAAQDYGDKPSYQAQQNAAKYVLIESLCIPVDEPDMDGRQVGEQAPPPADLGKLQAIRDLRSNLPEESGKSADELVEWAKDDDSRADATIKRLREELDKHQAAVEAAVAQEVSA